MNSTVDVERELTERLERRLGYLQDRYDSTGQEHWAEAIENTERLLDRLARRRGDAGGLSFRGGAIIGALLLSAWSWAMLITALGNLNIR